eukprot:GILJ01005982.1.p1 GENE.GILJ01005982.1~~GILJ01005982.1.p1  ORF type:complete len:988 (+),score=146.86 GILJ01005982.1:2024-4987(+)
MSHTKGRTASKLGHLPLGKALPSKNAEEEASNIMPKEKIHPRATTFADKDDDSQQPDFDTRVYETMVKRSAYTDERFQYEGDFAPLVNFYKFLARRPEGTKKDQQSSAGRLKLWIPDTVVYGDGEGPMWFYSSKEGYVYRTDSFQDKHVVSKLGNSQRLDDLVAVSKKPVRDKGGRVLQNRTNVMNTRELSLLVPAITSSAGEKMVIQKFIKCRGPKPFVCRAVWRQDKAPQAWIITGKTGFADEHERNYLKRFCTTTEIAHSCSIIQSSGQACKETWQLTADIKKYTERCLNVHFDEFVADFIKDEGGQWWFIQVKAFHLVHKMSPNVAAFVMQNDDGEMELEPTATHEKTLNLKGEVQRLVRCKFCQVGYKLDELAFEMTMKMIIDTEDHLRHRGRSFSWLDRADLRSVVDTPLLYRTHRVCRSCYKLYQQTEELKDLEGRFAKAIGIPCGKKAKELKEALMQRIKREQMKNHSNGDVESVDDSEVKELEIGRYGEAMIVVKEKNYVTDGGMLTRCRLLTFFQELRDIPVGWDSTHTYSLEYSLFNYTTRMPLEVRRSLRSEITVVPVNKLRVFYFFVDDRKGISDYVNEQKVLTVRLLCGSKVLGKVSFDLHDFQSSLVNKREFYQIFQGDDSLNTCSLKMTMGVIEGEKEDIAGLELHPHHGIYLPKDDYYTCDPLPDEWIDLLPDKKSYFHKLVHDANLNRSRKSSSNTGKWVDYRDSLGPEANIIPSVLKHTSVSPSSPLNRIKGEWMTSNRSLSSIASSSPRRIVEDEGDPWANESTSQLDDESARVVRSPLAQGGTTREPSVEPVQDELDTDARGDDCWNFIVQLHSAHHLGDADDRTTWKVSFSVLGKRFTFDGVARKRGDHCFVILDSNHRLRICAPADKLRHYFSLHPTISFNIRKIGSTEGAESGVYLSTISIESLLVRTAIEGTFDIVSKNRKKDHSSTPYLSATVVITPSKRRRGERVEKVLDSGVELLTEVQ